MFTPGEPKTVEAFVYWILVFTRMTGKILSLVAPTLSVGARAKRWERG